MTKAGMHGTMVHSLVNVLKQLGVSAFNRKGRLLYMVHKALSVSPSDRKGGFL